MDRWSAQEFENVKLDPDVGAVIVSTDYGISYLKILKAASYIANRKCLFIATDADEQFPSQNKSLTLAGSASAIFYFFIFCQPIFYYVIVDLMYVQEQDQWCQQSKLLQVTSLWLWGNQSPLLLISSVSGIICSRQEYL